MSKRLSKPSEASADTQSSCYFLDLVERRAKLRVGSEHQNEKVTSLVTYVDVLVNDNANGGVNVREVPAVVETRAIDFAIIGLDYYSGVLSKPLPNSHRTAFRRQELLSLHYVQKYESEHPIPARIEYIPFGFAFAGEKRFTIIKTFVVSGDFKYVSLPMGIVLKHGVISQLEGKRLMVSERLPSSMLSRSQAVNDLLNM